MAVPGSGNEVSTQRNIRAHFQPGGAAGDNKLLYAGQDMSYLSITGVSSPQLGGVDGIWVHDPNRVGRFKSIGTMIKNPDLSKFVLNLYERHNGIPRQFLQAGCKFNIYEAVGQCKDLSDINLGWTDYIAVYPGGVITGKDFGDRTPFEADKQNATKLDVTLERPVYAVGAMGFGKSGPAALTGAVISDVAFGGGAQCGDCGPENDGTLWQYAVQNGAAAAKPNLIYSVDGGQTWTSVAIAAAVNAETIVAMSIIGNRIVLLGPTAGTTVGGFYWADINPLTGVPGVFTKITTGFIAAGTPADMLAISGSEIWVVGAAGYIYKATDVTAGVVVASAGTYTANALTRIDGNLDCLVIGGASGTVLKSLSRGVVWSVTTAAPSANAINAVSVNGSQSYWVGDSAGGVFMTRNGGETWTGKTLETFAAVNDITFATPEVGWIAATTATPSARLYGTINGGYSWTKLASRVNNYPLHNQINRVAVPQSSDATVASNSVLLGGISTVGADGYMVRGASAIV